MTEGQLENVVVDCRSTVSRCFYCRNTWQFHAHGMTVSCTNVDTYQDLVDIGWTRSGFYIYKPIMNKMCCPAYTHRLNVNAFNLSRSQQKALRKWERYLQGGPMTATEERSPGLNGRHRRDHRCDQAPYQGLFRVLLRDIIERWFSINDYDQVELDVDIRRPSPSLAKRLGPSAFLTSPVCFPLFYSLDIDRQQQWKSADDIAKELCQIFREASHQILMKHFQDQPMKDRRHALDNVQLHHQNGHLNFHMDNGDQLQDVIEYFSSVVPPPDEIESASVHSTIDMCRTPSLGSSEAQSVRSLPVDFNISLERPRSFTVIWAPSVFDEEEYRLYRKYQMAVHGDSPRYIDRSRYRRFLVETPLKYRAPNADIPEPGMGSFHIQYRIDDRLVGVSVVDVLPRSLCSNYFFWDPDFASLQLGKISALLEIDWIRSATTTCPGLKYYYLGHYVHSCSKTRYKTSYAPSELLCPEKRVWVTLTDEVKSCLDASPYVVLSALPGVQCRPNHALMTEKSSLISTQKIQLPSGECRSFGDYIMKLESTSSMDKSRRQSLEQLKVMIMEWRAQTMTVANQLIYFCQWTP